MESKRAMDAALKFLAAKARTEAEMRARLAKEGCDEATAGEVIEKLKQYGYVDDESYALQYAKDKSKRLSARATRDRLRRRGIGGAALDLVTDENDLQAALAFARRALPAIAETDERKRRQKLTRRLLYRGFSYDVAAAVWVALTGGDGEPFCDE